MLLERVHEWIEAELARLVTGTLDELRHGFPWAVRLHRKAKPPTAHSQDMGETCNGIPLG